MYVYITTGPANDQYQVGFYTTRYSHNDTPYLAWNTESTHSTVKKAAARVNYLNGGTGQPQKHSTTPTPWHNPYKAQHG